VKVQELGGSKRKSSQDFPEVITGLPEADISFKGVKAWILQGEKHQLVFFEMDRSAQVPEHSHNYPQWGMVVDGEMKLTIDGKMRICKRGDDYLIPAKAKHYATFSRSSRVIDLFSERARYKPKTTE
jgi:quercetin dioxygenase-like cupin family protein